MDQPRNIVRIEIEGKGREQIGAVMETMRFPSFVSVSVPTESLVLPLSDLAFISKIGTVRSIQQRDNNL